MRAPRTPPPVTCPRCRCPKTKVLHTRYVASRIRRVRKRKCLTCGLKFRTEQDPIEYLAGLDPAA